MEPIDRYLKAVKVYLPREQQDDILKELSDNLLSEMEDRQAELGRPLDPAEQEAILERHGNPMLVAGHYQPVQRSVAFGRQLIGPALFPLYLRVLWINVGITVAVCVAAAVAFAGGQPVSQVGSAVLLHILLQFGIVTVVFTLAESHLARTPAAPRRSRRTRNRWNLRSALEGGQRVPRSQSISELIGITIAVLWWLAVPHYLDAMLGAAAVLRLGPGTRMLYLPILLLTLAGGVAPAVNLFRPDWTRFRSAARLVTTGSFLLVLCSS
ncbi:MAG: hypothetical protein M3O15_07670, partial [Acidobacteriota bacterium]|nr:hypothetical protein [Acidobacteriota bacterium]